RLYLRGINASSATAVATHLNVFDIAFRPNHQSITFLAQPPEAEHNMLFEVKLESAKVDTLFSFSRSILGYSWAPDGNNLAFMAKEAAPIRQGLSLPYYPTVYGEDYDQRKAFVTNVTLPQAPYHQFEMEGSIYNMQWAPNGKKLAITIAPTSLADDYQMNRDILITNRRGTEVLGRVQHQGKLSQLAWSPD